MNRNEILRAFAYHLYKVFHEKKKENLFESTRKKSSSLISSAPGQISFLLDFDFEHKLFRSLIFFLFSLLC